MHKIRKYAMIFSLGIITLPGILFLAKVTGLWRGKGRGESPEDRSTHDKLKEAKKALEKAMDLVQGALNHVQ
jgi:hypothetical protein